MASRFEDTFYTALGLAFVVGVGVTAFEAYEALSGPADASTAHKAGFLTGQVLVYGGVLAAVVLTALLIRYVWRLTRR